MSDNQLKILIEGYREENEQHVVVDEDWQQIYAAKQNSLVLQSDLLGIEVKLDKACGIVNVGHVRGLIPLEFSGVKDAHELKALVGQPVAFKIVRYDRDGETFIASRQEALEHMANITWKRLEPDAPTLAVVRAVERREALVDIGGIALTVPVQEYAYGWTDDMRDVVKPGDVWRVKVTELDKAAKTVSVSRKALLKNPWPDCSKRYTKGGQYVGRVSGLMEYGVFVNLEPNVDALVAHARLQEVKRGDKVLLRIAEVEVRTQRIHGRIVRKL